MVLLLFQFFPVFHWPGQSFYSFLLVSEVFLWSSIGQVRLSIFFDWAGQSFDRLPLARLVFVQSLIGHVSLSIVFHWQGQSFYSLPVARLVFWQSSIGQVSLLLVFHWSGQSIYSLPLVVNNQVLLGAPESISEVQISHSLPSFSYPICHYNGGILTMDPKNFQTPLNSDLILFPTCKNTYDKCEQSGANSCISNEHESHYLLPQRNLRPTNSTWITNSNFLLYLI